MIKSLPSASLTLSALRQAARNQSLPTQVLNSLQHDPRAGARALWAQAQRHRVATRSEGARLQRLLRHERALWAQGAEWVGGLDEVGVGPLLGPVVAAVVVLPRGLCIEGVDDSKKLSPLKREALAQLICAQALGVSIGQCSAVEIDAMNIHRATREAMRRAVVALDCGLHHLLVDAHRVPGVDVPQTALIGGDRVSHSIAAASIVAKVHRDNMMAAYDRRFPEYGFAQHKGYGTAAHLEALRRLGPTEEHRRSFAPVRLAARAHGEPPLT